MYSCPGKTSLHEEKKKTAVGIGGKDRLLGAGSKTLNRKGRKFVWGGRGGAYQPRKEKGVGGGYFVSPIVKKSLREISRSGGNQEKIFQTLQKKGKKKRKVEEWSGPPPWGELTPRGVQKARRVTSTWHLRVRKEDAREGTELGTFDASKFNP